MELVRIAKSACQCLTTTERESGYGPAVGIGKYIVTRLDEWNYRLCEFLGSELGVHRIVHLRLTSADHLGIWIGVWHHDYHLLCQTGCNEIVEDVVNLTYLEPCLVCIGHSMNEVQDRIFL